MREHAGKLRGGWIPSAYPLEFFEFHSETDPASAVLSTINPPAMRCNCLITRQIFLERNTIPVSIFA
jgi:hypothetical protein